MPLSLLTIPCLKDNYAYLIHDAVTGSTALIDAPEAAPIRAALSRQGWQLNDILITHHHSDHIDGVAELVAAYGAKVTGAAADAHRLPELDIAVRPGDPVSVGGEVGHVIDVSGHTVGHIAFHFPNSRLLFTADSLMALGCGRLFEGDGPMMWQNLSRMSALPDDTVICSGHEYTAANARFAVTIDPANPALMARIAATAAARARDEPTVPSLLGLERATNPFLRAADPAIRALLDLESASDAEVFTEIRKRKDRF